MKKFISLCTTVLLTLVLLIPAAGVSAASPYYSVGQTKTVKPGVYQDGKLVIEASKSPEKRPIASVTNIKDSIFYTEYRDMSIDISCQRADRYYTLKVKTKKSAPRSIASISEYMKDIATDGKYLYYVSAKRSYEGDLMRLSADGKKKEVLIKGVEDFWYRAGQLYYVKDATIYTLDKKTKKSQMLAIGKKKVKPESYCLGTSIQPGMNALIYREKVMSTQATYLVYEYRTKKTYRFLAKRFEKNGSYYNPISVVDVDIRRAEFIHDVGSLILVDAENKKLKELWRNDESSNILVEESDAVKRTITYVKGTQRIVQEY